MTDVVTHWPRSEARFVAYSARWVMGGLAALFAAFLTGSSWIIVNQYALLERVGDLRATLKQHAEKLNEYDRQLSALPEVKTEGAALRSMIEVVLERVKAHESRLQTHADAIVKAEGILHEMARSSVDLAAAVAENRATHLLVDSRLSELEKRINGGKR